MPRKREPNRYEALRPTEPVQSGTPAEPQIGTAKNVAPPEQQGSWQDRLEAARAANEQALVKMRSAGRHNAREIAHAEVQMDNELVVKMNTGVFNRASAEPASGQKEPEGDRGQDKRGQAPEVAQDWARLDRRNDGSLDLGVIVRAAKGMTARQAEGAAPGHGATVTRDENLAGPRESTSSDRGSEGRLDLGKLVRAAKEAKAQQVDEAALGRGDAATLRENPAAQAKAAQANVQSQSPREGSHAPEQGPEGPARESGQGTQRSSGRYSVLGR